MPTDEEFTHRLECHDFSIMERGHLNVLASASGGLLAGLLLGYIVGTPKMGGNSTQLEQAADESRLRSQTSLTTASFIADGSTSNQQTEDLSVARQDGISGQIRIAFQTRSRPAAVLRVVGLLSQLQLDEIPEALAFAEKATGDERQPLLLTTLARWAELDLKAALEWAKMQVDLKRLSADALDLCLSEWAIQNPTEARAWLAGLKVPSHQKAALQGYCAGLATRDPEAALRELSALSNGDNPWEAQLAIFRTWARQDIRAAAAGAARVEDESSRRLALSTVVEAWVGSAPQEALGWTLQLPELGDRQTAIRELFKHWTEATPSSALARLQSLPPELRDEALKVALPIAANQNLEEARRFAELLSPGNARDEAISVVVKNWAEQDPRSAAEYVHMLPEETAKVDMLGAIAGEWVRLEPAAAGEWAMQLPEGTGRVRATDVLISRWATDDPQGAAKWLENLPPGPTRDVGVCTYALKVSSMDPLAAMEWVTTVANPEQRSNTVRQVLTAWQRKDSAAARTWLETTPMIDNELRSELLAQRKTRRP